MVDKRCRICYASASLQNPLFHPCKCDGSVKYVHSQCLGTWLKSKDTLMCEVCQHQVDFEHSVPAAFQWLRLVCVLLSLGYIVADYLFRTFWYIPLAFVVSSFLLFSFYVAMETIPSCRPFKHPVNYSKPKKATASRSKV
ncbi:hypothetical protein QR680_009548 [Steinernema hermaphroditum]|uniref:RING-type E3 ubiquitin transferase n=1 Tax=Steinernema hermaphroditum TaxID=289476 RepID=A0AA39IMI3_9BILA|nr:hypothetical protein QR680_009548 [Steinernema hermaphroditum]